jgi:flagellar hook-associated protein FlgK
MQDFQEPMEQASDLGKRKQILEKMQKMFKQYPSFAKMWEWTRQLTDEQLTVLIKQLNEQIRDNNQKKSGSGTGGKTGGKGGGRGPAGPMGPG